MPARRGSLAAVLPVGALKAGKSYTARRPWQAHGTTFRVATDTMGIAVPADAMVALDRAEAGYGCVARRKKRLSRPACSIATAFAATVSTAVAYGTFQAFPISLIPVGRFPARTIKSRGSLLKAAAPSCPRSGEP